MKLDELYLDFLAQTGAKDVPAVLFFQVWRDDAKNFADPETQLPAWVCWYKAGASAYHAGTFPSDLAAGYRKAAAWVRLLAWERELHAALAALDRKTAAMLPPPEGVTMVSLDDPAELHNAIADALGEAPETKAARNYYAGMRFFGRDES